jgi:cysteine desulfurase
MRRRIYLDHAATSPLRPVAREAIERAWRWGMGNSASQHAEGREARSILEEARAQVAELVGALPEEVVFTSGATEASNLAIRGLIGPDERPMSHLVTTRLEHAATRATCEHLADEGRIVHTLANDAEGRVAFDGLEAHVAPDRSIVTVLAGHNELGTLQDLAALAERARASRARLHLDVVQAAGYVDLSGLEWDLLSVSSHKLGGPQGIGALVIRGGSRLAPLLMGGAQEGGRRPGTVPVALAAGFGAAATAARERRPEEAERLMRLRDRLGHLLTASRPWLRPLGPGLTAPRQALPHILSLAVTGMHGDELVSAMDDAGIAASSSSACLVGARSHVLEAIGVPEETGALRLSLGWDTREDEIDAAARRMAQVLEHMRTLSPFERRRPVLTRRAQEAGLVLTREHLEVAEAIHAFHQAKGVLPGPRHRARILPGDTLERLYPAGLSVLATWLGIPVPRGGCRPYAG